MKKKSLILLLAFSLIAIACGGSAEEVVEETVVEEAPAESLDSPATTAAPTLDKITFGFVPSAEQTELQDNIKPMMDVLSAGLGIEVEGFVTSDYSGLLVAMGSGQADVGAFNTLGYVNAMKAFPRRLEAIAKVFATVQVRTTEHSGLMTQVFVIHLQLLEHSKISMEYQHW
jgi:ABC-type phosphate/phosphonate transport system substrate-binding protein